MGTLPTYTNDTNLKSEPDVNDVFWNLFLPFPATDTEKQTSFVMYNPSKNNFSKIKETGCALMPTLNHIKLSDESENSFLLPAETEVYIGDIMDVKALTFAANSNNKNHVKNLRNFDKQFTNYVEIPSSRDKSSSSRRYNDSFRPFNHPPSSMSLDSVLDNMNNYQGSAYESKDSAENGQNKDHKAVQQKRHRYHASIYMPYLTPPWNSTTYRYAIPSSYNRWVETTNLLEGMGKLNPLEIILQDIYKQKFELVRDQEIKLHSDAIKQVETEREQIVKKFKEAEAKEKKRLEAEKKAKQEQAKLEAEKLEAEKKKLAALEEKSKELKATKAELEKEVEEKKEKLKELEKAEAASRPKTEANEPTPAENLQSSSTITRGESAVNVISETEDDMQTTNETEAHENSNVQVVTDSDLDNLNQNEESGQMTTETNHNNLEDQMETDANTSNANMTDTDMTPRANENPETQVSAGDSASQNDQMGDSTDIPAMEIPANPSEMTESHSVTEHPTNLTSEITENLNSVAESSEMQTTNEQNLCNRQNRTVITPIVEENDPAGQSESSNNLTMNQENVAPGDHAAATAQPTETAAPETNAPAAPATQTAEPAPNTAAEDPFNPDSVEALDVEVLNVLPLDMAREEIRERIRRAAQLRRQRQPIDHTTPLVRASFLTRLNENIQQLIKDLDEEERQDLRRISQVTNEQVNPDDFLASLPEELRREVLTELPPEQLAMLNTGLQQESQNLQRTNATRRPRTSNREGQPTTIRAHRTERESRNQHEMLHHHFDRLSDPRIIAELDRFNNYPNVLLNNININTNNYPRAHQTSNANHSQNHTSSVNVQRNFRNISQYLKSGESITKLLDKKFKIPERKNLSIQELLIIKNELKDLQPRSIIDQESLVCLLSLFFVPEMFVERAIFNQILKNILFTRESKVWLAKSMIEILQLTNNNVETPKIKDLRVTLEKGVIRVIGRSEP